jgi:RNA polymerase-binding transcription factor DksA
MTQRDLDRRRLLKRRDVLVRHFHDVLESADRELDACELEDGMFKAALWETHVLSQLGGELHELHDVIAALDRLDRRCDRCGAMIGNVALRDSPCTTTCSECAITEVMPARSTISRDHHAR